MGSDRVDISLQSLGNKYPGPKLPLIHHHRYSSGHPEVFAAFISPNAKVGVTLEECLKTIRIASNKL